MPPRAACGFCPAWAPATTAATTSRAATNSTSKPGWRRIRSCALWPPTASRTRPSVRPRRPIRNGSTAAPPGCSANFQIGGVNLEMGDFYVCHCDDCRRARAAIVSDEPDYYKDMAISHMVTLSTLRRLVPDAWLSYATYTGYTPRHDGPAAAVPLDDPRRRHLPVDVDRHGSAMGSPASADGPAQPGLPALVQHVHPTEHDFYLEEIRQICRQAAAARLRGPGHLRRTLR